MKTIGVRIMNRTHDWRRHQKERVACNRLDLLRQLYSESGPSGNKWIAFYEAQLNRAQVKHPLDCGKCNCFVCRNNLPVKYIPTIEDSYNEESLNST